MKATGDIRFTRPAIGNGPPLCEILLVLMLYRAVLPGTTRPMGNWAIPQGSKGTVVPSAGGAKVLPQSLASTRRNRWIASGAPYSDHRMGCPIPRWRLGAQAARLGRADRSGCQSIPAASPV